MSSRPKASGSVEAKQPSLEVAGEERSVITSACEQEIRRRAYELYLERGEEPGRDLEDWLQAERELKPRDHSPRRVGFDPSLSSKGKRYDDYLRNRRQHAPGSVF